MSRKRNLAITSLVTAFALAGGAHAALPAQEPADVLVLERHAQNFERGIELGALRVRYDSLLADARRLDAAPDRHLLRQRVAEEDELRSGIADLRERIERAKRERRAERAQEDATAVADAGSVAGVSMATLEAIAACESGGDPTAVNPAGYYGKYQFDLGTWQSVGGTGNPAAAPESEQDYRAALLYSQAGASPWPVCGA